MFQRGDPLHALVFAPAATDLCVLAAPAIELAKMHGLYPGGKGRKGRDPSDGYSAPMINLVMPDLEQ